jgi:hypothetical protein
VAVEVSVGEKSWLNVILLEAVALLQSGMPPVRPTVAPVQKIKDSGIVPVRTIGLAVLAVTVPVSVALPVVSVEANVDMRTKKVELAVVGFVTVISW